MELSAKQAARFVETRSNCGTVAPAERPTVAESLNRTTHALAGAKCALEVLALRLHGPHSLEQDATGPGVSDSPRVFRLIDAMNEQAVLADRVMRLARALLGFVGE